METDRTQHCRCDGVECIRTEHMIYTHEGLMQCMYVVTTMTIPISVAIHITVITDTIYTDNMLIDL